MATSTRAARTLYETFEPADARRILPRLEFHYTPKHASWLNIVEIEIGVMVSQCLDRRIPTRAMLGLRSEGLEQAGTAGGTVRRRASTGSSHWSEPEKSSAQSTGHILCGEVLVALGTRLRDMLRNLAR